MADSISAYSGQIAVRSKGQTTCLHHQSKPLELYCENCTDLCCSHCVPATHTGHTFVTLQELIPAKRREICEFIDSADNRDFSKLHQRIASALNLLQQDDREFNNLEQHVKNRGAILKENIDILTVRKISVCQQLKEGHAQLRKSYIQHLQTASDNLARNMQECKTLLQSGGHDVKLFDMAMQIKSFHNVPCMQEVTVPRFIPNRNQETCLEQAFGTLSTGDISPDQRSSNMLTSSNQEYTTHIKERSLQPNQPPPQYTLLQKATVVTKFRSPMAVTSIHPSGNATWAICKNNRHVVMLNNAGVLVEQRMHNRAISEIQVHPITREIWVCCFDENGITDCSTGQPKLRYQTQVKPRCVCVTSDGCVLIGMCRQISKYTVDGEHVRTTTLHETGNPFVCTPNKIVEYSVTGNIAFIDLDFSTDGGQGLRRIQMVTKEFTKLPSLKIESNTKKNRKTTADTCDIGYDSVGNLVLADGSTVFLIDGTTGESIRVLHVGRKPIVAIGLGEDDILWMVYGAKNKKVKMIKYSEKQDQ